MDPAFGKDPAAWTARRLPHSVQSRIHGTPLYAAYLRFRCVTTTLDEVQFPVGEGDIIAIRAPSGSDYHVARQNGRTHEPSLTEELLDELGEDDVFYDIGGGYGYMSQLARVAGVPDSSIHTFEGDIFNKHVLEQTLSDSSVTITEQYVGTSAEMISIDEYVSQRAVPTVVKIDVEGAEYDVLRCMRRTLENNDVRLYIEIHPGLLPEFGASPADVESLLDDLGYRHEMIDHRAEGINWEATDELPDETGYLIRVRSV